MHGDQEEEAIPAENLELYDTLIATNLKIERKGDVHPYTSVNGHMFTYLDQTGTMGIRLPDEELQAFLKKYKITLFQSYGVVKRGLGDGARRPIEEHKGAAEISGNQLRKHQDAEAEVIGAYHGSGLPR